ncbi:nuclear transport factor 2 family protein [Planomonospora sp. ID67723]|uniref:nuclear transport factor 2 family protein n=1 Tax=Planomonospora sp. ID67723 TaxID=2738134 RepID=UPI0018C397E3|nr:nuclear transport factor 2 family protein [Planomonospora sp. ID67723]MBG0833261.1 nuclear transport factor 2 family protein [Planomonospora sp. ID67723]
MTPREVFDRMREHWIANETVFDDDSLTGDVILEMPFAPPGRPSRIEGRAAVLAFIRAGHADLPFRFDDCRALAVHDTADPDTIVVEYELTATMTAAGVSAAAPFIGVLTVHEGRIARWREYQNPLAVAWALQAAES